MELGIECYNSDKVAINNYPHSVCYIHFRGFLLSDMDLYFKMCLSRAFEEKIDELFKDGALYGTTHLSIGQEASHVGLVAALDKADYIVPTHRCHGFNIAKGTSIRRMFSEMFGSRDGICKGLGGSMHMSDVATYNLGSSAVVGSGIPLAAGAAFAEKRLKKNNISVAIFGDGATSRGTLHETMNIASVWALPLMFYLENNHYGMSASADRMISTKEIYKRAAGYGIESIYVEDGNDVFAVLDAAKRAREYIIENKGPVFVEVNTYRQCGHSKSDKRIYRDRLEEEEWSERDPLLVAANSLLERGFKKEDIESAKNEAYSFVESEYREAEKIKDETLSISELSEYVYAPSPLSASESSNMHNSSYRGAIREALDEILRTDKRALFFGEDIAKYGGCFGVTGDLWKRHKDRVIETPVSEESFTGLAVGAAMTGLHPIVEIMYGDFSTLASDPLINHAAKAYFMSAGQFTAPIIYRTAGGGGTGHGSQHTQSLETMFLNIPGLIVVAPSSPYSAKALLKSANRSNNPVLFFEHKALYGEVDMVGDENAYLPLGKAIVRKIGWKVLVIGYSRAYRVAESALKDVERDITFIDLATIKPLDEETIKFYAKTFDRILIVEDTPLQNSVAESVMRIVRSVNDKCRIVTATALDMPLPFSKKLERDVMLNEDRVRSQYLELFM